jgi:hypothetical protein
MQPLVTGRAPWSSWIGILLAITLFFFVGFTRNAKQSYEHCIEWLYDHSPSKLQAKAAGMRKLSDKCKERRAIEKALARGEGQVLQPVKPYNFFFDVSLTGSKPNRGNRAKNWFDAEDDDSADSIHSSEATFQNREDDKGRATSQMGQSFNFTSNKTEVAGGLGPVPRLTQGVTVTRQVLVETSPV